MPFRRLGFASLLLLAGAGHAAVVEQPVLKRVVLSTAGLATFEYEAVVEGDAELGLALRMDQVDDALKSMVVEDRGGRVEAMSLPSRDSLATIFRDFAFPQGALESEVSLLSALRGNRVEIAGDQAMAGQLIAVETTQTIQDGKTEQRYRLAVLTDAGLRQVMLDEIQSLRFADPKLQEQVGRALAAIADSRGGQFRTLAIKVAGPGRRTVRLAHVAAAPVWKTAYRLELPENGNAGRLQGWAILENTTGRDWTGVALTLTSGNPVAFRQELYASYNLDRPVVPIDLPNRILPPVDRESFAQNSMMAGSVVPSTSRALAKAAPMGDLRAPAPAPVMAPAAEPPPPPPPMAAEARDTTAQVTLTLPNPVSVASGHSLAVPVIDRSVPARQVGLYAAETNAQHPVIAVELENDGGFGLPPGALTFYGSGAAGTYLGDGRLAALPNGEKRLVSFALDERMAIQRDVSSTTGRVLATIANGVLRIVMTDRQTTIYRIKAAPGAARDLIIEHPRAPDETLVEPAGPGIQLTAARYRFPVSVAAGQELAFTVTIDRPRPELIQLTDADPADLGTYLAMVGIDPGFKAIVQKLVELKGASQDAERRLATLTGESEAIGTEQERIRANLQVVPAGSDLQKRYLRRMGEQEDRLARLQTETDQARARLNETNRALESYISGLKL